jgi:aminoglycoside phosphotransferase (APT) family kinase protein
VPVENGGWDNIPFRLGDNMSVCLPRALAYVAEVEKEHCWLPVLRPQLPLPIAVPLGLGIAGAGYPWPWSIYRRLDGERAHIHSIHGLDRFATDLAGFLVALREIERATDLLPALIISTTAARSPSTTLRCATRLRRWLTRLPSAR